VLAIPQRFCRFRRSDCSDSIAFRLDSTREIDPLGAWLALAPPEAPVLGLDPTRPS
jgi:hypothetical protein